MENINFFQKDDLYDLNNNLNNIYNSNNNNNIINTSSTQNIDDGTQVDIKIPKPYPIAINENKKYNNKIHNNNSKKQNKNLNEQKVSNNLNYKNITNKINDFNLKVIDFNPQEIEINKINNLEESIDLINKLKEK
jgi:tRNA U34 5-carboxymethylaminomethyl modifying enzyme MnmG/GidA